MAKTKTETQIAQQPLILRAHRLMEAFAKSDDERDFYIDRTEGFLVYVDLDKSQQELDLLEKELATNASRYFMIPKLTSYEAKKIMEGFVNEKVYDIDTKEKLLDIIQSKEARTNFLEFIYDHHSELEKWQQYYQERSRIRIIEWLRQQHFHFVFEEDLEFARSLLEKLKQALFESKPNKEIDAARKILISKAKSYYSNEALNPRPKRGRPPKQAAKQEIEPQITSDVYLTVTNTMRPFLFSPEITGAAGLTFSSDFDAQGQLAARRQATESDTSLANFQQKLAALRQLSTHWVQDPKKPSGALLDDFDDDDDEDEEETSVRKRSGKGKANEAKKTKMTPASKPSKEKPTKKTAVSKKAKAAKPAAKQPIPGKRPKPKRIIPVQKKIETKTQKKPTPQTKNNVVSKKVVPAKRIMPKAKKR